jgi:hypothetical protein
MTEEESTVYLLHFDQPYRHARHYQGWAADLERRLAEHRAGGQAAARLMQVIHAEGIGCTLARTWRGTRGRERQLKVQGGASRRCPVCIAVRDASRPSGRRQRRTP